MLVKVFIMQKDKTNKPQFKKIELPHLPKPKDKIEIDGIFYRVHPIFEARDGEEMYIPLKQITNGRIL